jgi:hypothetical protein
MATFLLGRSCGILSGRSDEMLGRERTPVDNSDLVQIADAIAVEAHRG